MVHKEKTKPKKSRETVIQEVRYSGNLGFSSFEIVWIGYFALLCQYINIIPKLFYSQNNLSLQMLQLLNYVEPWNIVESSANAIEIVPDFLQSTFDIPKELTMIYIMSFPLFAAGILSLLASSATEYGLRFKHTQLRKKLTRGKK